MTFLLSLFLLFSCFCGFDVSLIIFLRTNYDEIIIERSENLMSNIKLIEFCIFQTVAVWLPQNSLSLNFLFGSHVYLKIHMEYTRDTVFFFFLVFFKTPFCTLDLVICLLVQNFFVE